MAEVSPLKKASANPSISSSKTSDKDFNKQIQERRSQELILGLCGAVGSGVKALKNNLVHSLESSGYKVHHIRLSDIIAEHTVPSLKDLLGYPRYTELQDKGNELRVKHKSSILAALAIEEIALHRMKTCAEEAKELEDGELLKTTQKIAYIIDQLKNPDEAELFRSVYPRNFYLLGLIRTEKERRLNLEEEKITPSEIDKLIRRDRKDSEDYGQQVEKTIQNSDYFIHNIHNQNQHIESAVTRFIRLVHGVNGVTPTIDEIGMHAAYSASLRSACLSRQVGAAILDKDGNIISSGCNDVPSFSGGLYNSNSRFDYRCVHRGQCSNDKHKNLLKEEIRDILKAEVDSDKVDDLVEKVTSKTKIKSLIEYSRAVHAEMDAIVALARNTKESAVGTTLYATTYPCHNCARHIVAAGISKVIYIEPYEKSLAIKLHDDSLSESCENHKVHLAPFEGVSPRRFEAFFRVNSKRKNDSGKVIKIKVNDSYHADSEIVDNYQEIEAKIVQSLENTIRAN